MLPNAGEREDGIVGDSEFEQPNEQVKCILARRRRRLETNGCRNGIPTARETGGGSIEADSRHSIAWHNQATIGAEQVQVIVVSHYFGLYWHMLAPVLLLIDRLRFEDADEDDVDDSEQSDPTTTSISAAAAATTTIKAAVVEKANLIGSIRSKSGKVDSTKDRIVAEVAALRQHPGSRGTAAEASRDRQLSDTIYGESNK